MPFACWAELNRFHVAMMLHPPLASNLHGSDLKFCMPPSLPLVRGVDGGVAVDVGAVLVLELVHAVAL